MWCLIAFLLTFLVTRTIVRYIRHNENNNADGTPPPSGGSRATWGHGSTHIHHVVIGVILVMVSGVTMVTLAVDGGVPEFTVAAILFGMGAALVLDEFALILHLQDVYWSEDGRTSVDAVFAAVAVAGGCSSSASTRCPSSTSTSGGRTRRCWLGPPSSG